MNDQHFNLVSDPWIKVIDLNAETQTVSMCELFKNANQYRQLAGEMRSQDLAIMRFLLAVLQTVYS
ncbi:type I-E CRISPR-associated protein Cse1/CasA, partial [Lactobacillus sp. XV13L]|nr:type I-E CRISPR-associated protein Cse1/CasA [Lactobacillus sp. XV13L]